MTNLTHLDATYNVHEVMTSCMFITIEQIVYGQVLKSHHVNNILNIIQWQGPTTSK
jgi:hypothetical protein